MLGPSGWHRSNWDWTQKVSWQWHRPGPMETLEEKGERERKKMNLIWKEI